MDPPSHPLSAADCRGARRRPALVASGQGCLYLGLFHLQGCLYLVHSSLSRPFPPSRVQVTDVPPNRISEVRLTYASPVFPLL